MTPAAKMSRFAGIKQVKSARTMPPLRTGACAGAANPIRPRFQRPSSRERFTVQTACAGVLRGSSMKISPPNQPSPPPDFFARSLSPGRSSPCRARVSQLRRATPRPSTSNASCSISAWARRADNSTRVEAATFRLVNVSGPATTGPLRQQRRSRPVSARHSEDMVDDNYFDHVSPAARRRSRGSRPAPTCRAARRTWSARTSRRHDAAGHTGIDRRGLDASPDHRANILNPDFRDSGIGDHPRAPRRYSGGQHGATYTQQFGVIARG